MNIERAIEFLLKNQSQVDARFNAKFDRADQRFIHAEKRLDRLERLVKQNNHLVTRLARAGVSLRSDVRRTEKNLAKVSDSLSEMDDKLRALTDRRIRGNGHRQ